MKKRLFQILLTCAAALALTVSAGAVTMSPSRAEISTDITDMTLTDNAMGNYVRGIGSAHSPAASFLRTNEDGGVTLLQVQGRNGYATVSDFDPGLEFVRTREISLRGAYGHYNDWGTFCAAEDANYLIFLDRNTLSEDVLRVDKYSADWSEWYGNSYGSLTYYTRGLIANDMDAAMCGEELVIVSNHTLKSSDSTVNGHEANFRVQINGESMELTARHIGTGFSGYCSHSFVPEVAVSDGRIYTFDRSDANPGNGIFMSVFDGSLYSTLSSYQGVTGHTFRCWGSQGNAVPAAGGVLTAYTYAPASSSNTDTNVYLYFNKYGSGSSKLQVTYAGGAGTPYVVPVDENSGFVMWNPDRFVRDEPLDTLYYAAYTVSGTGISVGAVNRAEGHYLSDCEPIPFEGGVLWYTVEMGELIFHKLHPTQGLSTVLHHNWETVEGREATCAKPGLTEGVQCAGCGLWLVEQEEIETLPHTEQTLPAVPATCAETGLTEGKKCTVCGTVTVEQEETETLPHTEQIIPAVPPTCTESGRTEGKTCSVCGRTIVRQDSVSNLGHERREVPRVEATYYADGATRGFICTRCDQWTRPPEVIPRRQVELRSVGPVPGTERLNISLVRPCKDPINAVCVFYDGDGRMLDLQFTGKLGEYDSLMCSNVKGAARIAVFVFDDALIPLGPVGSSELTSI